MDIEGMDETERLGILNTLRRSNPNTDWQSTLAGKLAGRATPDRPDVPVWEYRDYARLHPEVSLDALFAVRFPVIFFGGEDSTIDSVNEHLGLNQARVKPAIPVTVDSVLGMYARLHEAGVIRWNSELRAVEHVAPLNEYRRVIAEWAATELEGVHTSSWPRSQHEASRD